MDDLYVSVVCSSNMNRSMEAHAFLMKKGFKVKSYGTGDMVRLPGTATDLPICYEFGVPYNDIYNDLVAKDKSFYTQNGILNMLNRNQRIKPCPEKFQTSDDLFDVIVTCEKRVFEQVMEFFSTRRSVFNQPVHIVNIDIQDNHEEATIGAFIISDMITKMAQCNDLDNDIDELISNFEAECHRSIMYCVMFY